MKSGNLKCSECEYLKCIAIVYQNYYCDNEGRIDDMGKLRLMINLNDFAAGVSFLLLF